MRRLPRTGCFVIGLVVLAGLADPTSARAQVSSERAPAAKPAAFDPKRVPTTAGEVELLHSLDVEQSTALMREALYANNLQLMAVMASDYERVRGGDVVRLDRAFLYPARNLVIESSGGRPDRRR